MQKVFKSYYEMDRRCYEEYHLTEDILMEHASEAMASFIKSNFKRGSSVSIIAGAGNNGADGITLARLLSKDYEIYLYLLLGAKSQMAKLQLERAKLVGVEPVNGIREADIIVDAIFGAGLNRELSEDIVHIVNEMNMLKGYKIACDIPTGIDSEGRVSPIAFRADTTITMGALKEALFLDEAKDFVGEIIVADLGVARELYEFEECDSYWLDKSDFNPPKREALTSHKGSFGHASIFCGEKSGAGIICAMAATKFGSGLTTLIYHEKINPPYHLMSSTKVPQNTTAIAVGMGFGNHFEREIIQNSIIYSDTPIVIDADFFYREELKELVTQQDRKVVFTPHPKEFASMWKILKNQDLSIEYIQKNRFGLLKEFIDSYPHITLLLKGANMLIASEGKIYINTLGLPNLSKGGSGDVLSGLIVALLAQGYSAKDSAINGSLALALASRVYDGNSYSMVAEDIINNLSKI